MCRKLRCAGKNPLRWIFGHKKAQAYRLVQDPEGLFGHRVSKNTWYVCDVTTIAEPSQTAIRGITVCICGRTAVTFQPTIEPQRHQPPPRLWLASPDPEMINQAVTYASNWPGPRCTYSRATACSSTVSRKSIAAASAGPLNTSMLAWPRPSTQCSSLRTPARSSAAL